ncbi:MAG: tail protein X, partial [Exilibacterium sp.]
DNTPTTTPAPEHAGDTLDWICWQYYVKEINLGTAAMAIDPKLLINNTAMENGFLLGPQSDENARGTVETVLQANPGLAAFPLSLPAGLEILLPDIDAERVENNTVKLWD